jgi:hypothetical protein
MGCNRMEPIVKRLEKIEVEDEDDEVSQTHLLQARALNLINLKSLFFL